MKHRRPGIGLACLLATATLAPAQAQDAPLHPEPQPRGHVDLTVHCAAHAQRNGLVATGVPLPRDWVTDPGRLRLEQADGHATASDRIPLAYWPRNGSVRSVLLVFRHQCGDERRQVLRLRWGEASTPPAGLGITPDNVATLWGPQAAPAADEHPATDRYPAPAGGIPEPAVWATLPADWLMRAGVRPPMAAPADPAVVPLWLGFARTYVNDVATDVVATERDDGRGLIDWRVEVEGWLYDRPFNLWTTYLLTGDVKWLRHAHRASQFYASRIAPDDRQPPYRRGAFVQKPPTGPNDRGDLKYAYNGGLLAAYLLTGDARLLAPIRAVATFAEADFAGPLPPYAQTHGLWTERHLATAVWAALHAYEATGNDDDRRRVERLIEGMRRDVETPPRGYPDAARMGGVLLHRAEVHEGVATGDVYLSPWMAALLGEALWRTHFLTADRRALRLLADYAEWIARFGTYEATADPRSGALLVPWYGVGLRRGYSAGSVADDLEHAPDVLGLLARGRWARAALAEPTERIDAALRRLRPATLSTWRRWQRDSPGLPRARLAPTRKFGWWFGTTYDLGWFGVL